MNPLVLFDNSIDFVQQIHWFRSTIPLVLFRRTVAFAPPFHRFHRSFSAVLSRSPADKKKQAFRFSLKKKSLRHAVFCGVFVSIYKGARRRPRNWGWIVVPLYDAGSWWLETMYLYAYMRFRMCFSPFSSVYCSMTIPWCWVLSGRRRPERS